MAQTLTSVGTSALMPELTAQDNIATASFPATAQNGAGQFPELDQAAIMSSLEKTYMGSFFRIDALENGKYRVTRPGLIDLKSGYYVGTTSSTFECWDDAAAFYLLSHEKHQKVIHKPLLNIQTAENEMIAFSHVKNFNPRVAPSERIHIIPLSAKKYIMSEEKMMGSADSAHTYQQTILEKGWEKALYEFISGYLKAEGKEVATRLNIVHLDALSPSQALNLSVEVVVDLTKYRCSDTSDSRSDLSTPPAKTTADVSTVLEILQAGLIHRNDLHWEGNGICRNFASAVKALFEALKENQTRFSQLGNTYCLFDSGKKDEYTPKSLTYSFLQINIFAEQDRVGHAWNTFVTVSDTGTSHATTVDATWAIRNPKTNLVEDLDYTLARMEGVVHAIGEALSSEIPKSQQGLAQLLKYYALRIGYLYPDAHKLPATGTLNTKQNELERHYYVARVVELIRRNGVPDELPITLIAAIGRDYVKIAEKADVCEIETAYAISQRHSDINFHQILNSYLNDKSLHNYHVTALLFRDNSLQKAALEALQTRAGFATLIEGSPMFRVRVREVAPEIVGIFSPETRAGDALELKYLVRQSKYLGSHELQMSGKPSLEEPRKLFEAMRNRLITANPAKYQKDICALDNYEIIRRFDSIFAEFLV